VIDEWRDGFPSGCSSTDNSAATICRFGGLPLDELAAVHESGIGTELPTSALQRFRPESEGQLTFGGRDREDRS